MSAVVQPDLVPGLPDEKTRGLLRAVVVLRVALLVWATVVVAIDVTGVTSIRGVQAFVVLGVLFAWTVFYGWLLRSRPVLVHSSRVGLVDVALASLVAAGDMALYTGPHPQTFASAWPLCAAVVAGVVHGRRVGAAAGLLIGLSGALGLAVFADGGLDGRWLGAVGTIVLVTVSGALAGMVTALLREAEMSTARSQAREEVARSLHDGVLQTLAAVQRRSEDPELVGLAREQELELRHFVGSAAPAGRGNLVAEMRSTLVTAERRTRLRCELIVIDVPSRSTSDMVAGLCGAVTEAITNAATHGAASLVTVCLDSDRESVFCSVNDDGTGFCLEDVVEGVGLSRSIRGRIEQLGGSVGIDSNPGAGCEVTMTVPVKGNRR